MIRETFRREITGVNGQTASEYVIVLGVITLPIVIAFALLSSAIQSLLDAAADFFS
jgi:Flp pilus assembly pilin Flp